MTYTVPLFAPTLFPSHQPSLALVYSHSRSLRSQGAADIVRRAYRCHRFVCRFNKKAHERKKAALALQLLMHKKVNMIIRCFRTHRFLAVFNQKAHARKLRWMAEAEARALEEYNAACFLQDCYMRSRNRANMSLRFNDRKNMIKQAEVLRHQNKKVLIIQMAYNKFKGRENLQSKIMMRKLREEDEKKQRLLLAQKKAVFKQRMKASKVIQHNYRTYRFLVIFNGKARERKEMWLAQQLLEHNSSVVIQHSYRTHRFLSIFNGKTHERKQRWLAQQLLEHNSATIVQKNYRTYRFLMAFMKKTHERKKRWMREAEQKAKEEYEAMLDRQATRIQMFCQSQMEKYNQPVRILARRQLEMKRRIIREKLAAERLEKAARIVQHAWRLKGEKDMLMGRFTKRRALMQKKGDELRRNDMATKIAHAYLRHLDQKALRRRVLGRAKLHEKIAIHRARDAAARVLQRNFRLSRARFVQSLKFEQMRRRLAAERLLEEQTALAELAARRAAEARMAAEEALKQMVSQGWKLGSDPHERNYWYNWVTGESTWVKPPGWKIKQDETWVKNTDSNGNVYYFNQLTMETKWMPPCEVCQKEGGKRICEDCDFKTYCLNCFESTHEHMNGGKDHRWKGADIDKEPLEKGEKCVRERTCASERARASESARAKVRERSEHISLASSTGTRSLNSSLAYTSGSKRLGPLGPNKHADQNTPNALSLFTPTYVWRFLSLPLTLASLAGTASSAKSRPPRSAARCARTRTVSGALGTSTLSGTSASTRGSRGPSTRRDGRRSREESRARGTTTSTPRRWRASTRSRKNSCWRKSWRSTRSTCSTSRRTRRTRTGSRSCRRRCSSTSTKRTSCGSR